MTTDGGWIPWEGGDDPPVPPYELVNVRFRKIDASDEDSAEFASVFRWNHKGWDGDIIAYRVVLEANALDSDSGGE